jgi:hypothetical protein
MNIIIYFKVKGLTAVTMTAANVGMAAATLGTMGMGTENQTQDEAGLSKEVL